MRIHTLSILVSENSPFREVLFQLVVHTKLQLGLISDASCLWTDGRPFVIGPELFQSENLELGLSERIFQLFGASTKTISFFVDWKDLLPKKTDGDMVIQEFIALVDTYCPIAEGLQLVLLVLEEPSLEFDTGDCALLEKFLAQLRSIHWQAYTGCSQKLPDGLIARFIEL